MTRPALILVLLLSVLVPAHAARAQPVITAQNPHGYGWWLGDELVQRIHIALPAGVTVDPASLPRARAVDYWLDLRSVTASPTGSGLDLTLRWQNFYSALEPGRREVPPSPIRLSDGSAALLPGFAFVTSPIRPLMAPSTRDQLQPDPRFHLIDPWPARAGLGLSLAALALSAGALAWHQAWGPFRARPARPFTRAARALARQPDRRLLHRAFDAAFGRVLIGAELPQFLRARPEFGPLAARLSAFFATSDEVFFGRGDSAADDVAALARDLALIERGQR